MQNAHRTIRQRPQTQNRGAMLVSILVVTGLFVTLGMLALQFVISQNAASRFRVERERAFQIAEAGVEYYRWHLAHVPDDFQDGTGAAGPYVHDFRDTTGNVIGTFTLDITPPPSGSTVATITSTGQLTNRPTSARTVVVRQGIPSFTKWAVVANADIRFGIGTEVFGPIHSNGGIRFDGLAHNLVTSYRYAYDDPDHTGGDELAVHTHIAPTDALPPATPPATIASRPDVFEAGRQVQADYVDFANITADLQGLQTKAIASGIHLLPSGGQGYHLTLRVDGKVDMRVVNAQLRCQYNASGTWRDFGYCSNDYNTSCTQSSQCSSGATCVQSSHSIGTRANDQTSFTYNSGSSLGVDLPANGIIFVEDDVWIDGAVDNARVTVVAAREPLASGRANIYINKDLTYTPVGDASGSDVIGLIAQDNILVGYFSEDDIRIDAAMIAQNGRVGRPYYGAGFTSSTNNANFQLYPTGGICVGNPSRACAANGDCTNYCQATPALNCTTDGQCNNKCSGDTDRACTVDGNCVNYCNSNTTRACTTNTNCRNYCQNDATRSCTTNARCNGWCTGDHTRGCSQNSHCTGFGTCDLSAPDVGPCVTTDTCVTVSTGPCKSGDTCVTTDTCTQSTNPNGGSTCQEYRKRTQLTNFGAIATNQRYGFAWTGTSLFDCGGGAFNNSGYCLRNLIFDANLSFAPPPDFPTTGQYETLSWEEQ